MSVPKKVLFLANHFLTLYSFRLELIKRLLDDGNKVYISIPPAEENSYFSDMGCVIIDTPMSRRGMNPLQDFKLLVNYRKIMRLLNPDIVFSYTVKPNIYGSIVSNALGYRQICNITGTGATFLKDSLLSKFVGFLYRSSIKKCRKVYFQNTGDRDLFIKRGYVTDNWDLLPGSGVNLERFKLMDMPSDSTINFIFIGRIMKLKGIDEYLECAKVIKAKFPSTRFFVAGFIEEARYQTIIEQYQNEGYVEYVGFQKDISVWLQKCHCVVLPSYNEGISNVLLESAATGRPVITTKVAGCIETFDEGVSGFGCNKKDTKDLAEKIIKFIELPFAQKREMGIAGRKKMELQFNRQIVVEAYLHEIESIKRMRKNVAL